jgi:hypothetical protein
MEDDRMTTQDELTNPNVFTTSGGVELKLKVIPHALLGILVKRLSAPDIEESDPDYLTKMEEFEGRNLSFLLSFGLVTTPVDQDAVDLIKTSLKDIGLNPVLSDWALYVSSVLITDGAEFARLVEAIKVYNHIDNLSQIAPAKES